MKFHVSGVSNWDVVWSLVTFKHHYNCWTLCVKYFQLTKIISSVLNGNSLNITLMPSRNKRSSRLINLPQIKYKWKTLIRAIWTNKTTWLEGNRQAPNKYRNYLVCEWVWVYMCRSKRQLASITRNRPIYYLRRLEWIYQRLFQSLVKLLRRYVRVIFPVWTKPPLQYLIKPILVHHSCSLFRI